MQLLCRVPTFQIMLRDAVDAANDNEDDENEYHTIEKITPHEVEQQHPVDIESKFLDDISTKTNKKGHLIV